MQQWGHNVAHQQDGQISGAVIGAMVVQVQPQDVQVSCLSNAVQGGALPISGSAAANL